MITTLRTTPVLWVAVMAILMVAAFAITMTLTRHGAAPHLGAFTYQGATHGIRPLFTYQG